MSAAASEARRPRRSSRATRARVSPESLLSSDDNASDSGDDFRGSAPNPSERKRRTRGTGNARGRKRVRAERPAALPRAPVSTATGAKRPPARRGLRTLNAAQTRANLQIKDDNVLFNAVISPSTALQSTAEDWVMQYQTNVGLALSQLITCILRASACNETLDEDQAQDLDSVVDTLDDIQEIFKRDSPAAYPLISRAAQYKKFRPNLAELLRRIFTSAADADLLQDGTLLPALAAWLSAGSSSPIRSFRHTSTEAALLSVTSLLTIQADGRQECAKLTKQRDAEKAKARVNKSRLQEHESRLNDTTAMVVQISDFIKDMISGVYVHRYRDTDPSIRADCIHELGLWMAHDPENFLRPAYFTYLGLVIADEDVRVRVTAVNAMANLYGPYLRPAVRQFTQRFLPRLLEMARGDVDLAVRCRTLQLLSQINEHQVLGAQEQDEVAMQIFSAEPKIRTAVAPFVISVLLRNADHIKEAVIGRRIAQDGHGNWTEEDESFAIFKSFSQVLSQGAQIDTVIKPTPFVAHETSRVGFAIEALWEEASNLSNWPGVLDLILQGQPEEERAAVDGALADAEMSQRQQDGFAINRVQEATLLEAMPTMIAKAQEEAETNPEVAETAPDLGMILSAVPRLLSRHRTDSVVELRILSLVPYIPKARLAEGDDNSDRDALWSELHALLLRHKDPALLAKAAAGMERISTATSGAGVTGATDRMATLAEELIQHLRDAAAERDLETATLNDNDIYALQSTCARLQAVMGTHRGTDFFNAEADATPAWDILHALVSRGRLGYEEEALLVADALKTLEVYTLWLAKDATYEEERVGRIHTAVSSYLNLLQEYTRIGDTDANSRVMEAALEAVVSYLILREALVDNRDEAQDKDNPSTGATTQQILAKALRAALGSYEADDSIPANVQAVTNEAVEAFSVRHQNGAKQSQHEGSDAGSDQEDSDANTPVPETGEQNEDPQVVARKAELAHRACIGLGQLVRLAHLGILRIHKLAPAVAQYGRINPAYDALTKSAVEVARALSSLRHTQEDVVSFVETTLTMAQEAVTDGTVPTAVVQRLARLLSGALVLRGRNLSIVGGVQGPALIALHEHLLGRWLDRTASAEKSGQRRAVARTLPAFRMLAQLLAGARPRDAISIKITLDSKVAALKDVLPINNTKAMEHVQFYERRLVSIASRLDDLGKIAPEPAPVPQDQGHQREQHETAAAPETENQTTRPRPRPSQPHSDNAKRGTKAARDSAPEADSDIASRHEHEHGHEAEGEAEGEAEVQSEAPELEPPVSEGGGTDADQTDATEKRPRSEVDEDLTPPPSPGDDGTHHVEPTEPSRKRVRRA